MYHVFNLSLHDNTPTYRFDMRALAACAHARKLIKNKAAIQSSQRQKIPEGEAFLLSRVSQRCGKSILKVRATFRFTPHQIPGHSSCTLPVCTYTLHRRWIFHSFVGFYLTHCPCTLSYLSQLINHLDACNF